MKFVGRIAELVMLDRFYQYRKAALLILYGRHAVGKSRLVAHWLKARHIDRAFYWTVPAQAAALQLQDFMQALAAFDPRPDRLLHAEVGYSNWHTALSQLADLAAHRPEQPTLVVIDDFTQLLKRDPSVASDFQIAWDHQLARQPNLRLALIGSADRLLEHGVLSSRAPLYGRATFLHRLRPLNFADLHDLFRGWSPAERVAGYAVTGGLPASVKWLAGADSLSEGLARAMAVDSPLRIEPRRLIADQVREPTVVEAVLSAIGDGVHIEDEIARRTSLGRLKLSRLLYQLAWSELIERRLPVFSSLAMRRERYFLRDPLLRFYYHVLVPYERLVRQGRSLSSLRTLRIVLNTWIADEVFPELCKDWIWAEAVRGTLGFVPQTVGGYWEDGTDETSSTEVIAVSIPDKRLFIADAAWRAKPISCRMLSDFLKRAQRVPYVNDPEWTVEYGFFSSNGLTPAASAEATARNMRSVSLSELESRLVQVVHKHKRSRRGGSLST